MSQGSRASVRKSAIRVRRDVPLFPKACLRSTAHVATTINTLNFLRSFRAGCCFPLDLLPTFHYSPLSRDAPFALWGICRPFVKIFAIKWTNGLTPLPPPLSNQYVFYTTHFRRCFTIHHPTIYCYSSRQTTGSPLSRF